eukprot:5081579-Pyramimonas_sp.AAC.1
MEKHLQADIKAAIGVLFGDASAKFKAAKEEHQALLGRLQKEKRKVDGAKGDGEPASAAATPAPGGPQPPS